MKNSKFRSKFGIGRKFIFTLALFVLCFAVANVVRIQAGEGDSGRGWLWGGSEDADLAPADGLANGNETMLYDISMNNVDGGGSYDYGVNIPIGDGDVTGYAWSNTVGWIDFNPQDHCGSDYAAASCSPPSGSAGVFRSGNTLTGWARIVGIATESAVDNSGGWEGWIYVDNVAINSDNTLQGYGWHGEALAPAGSNNYAYGLGYVDFSNAWIEVSCTPACGSEDNNSFCAGTSGPTGQLCLEGSASPVSGSGPWTWTCECGGNTVTCDSAVDPPIDGVCGDAAGKNFCDGSVTGTLCEFGSASSVTGTLELQWTCSGECGGDDVTCTASGRCGQIEVNP